MERLLMNELIASREIQFEVEAKVDLFKQEFAKLGYVKLTSFFTQDVIDSLIQESYRLLDTHAKRKDFLMDETNFTPRKISTVSGHVIDKESQLISDLYCNEGVLNFLEEIANVRLFETPDVADKHAIHKLHRKNDIHGGHVDTYPFVLITCLESPGQDGGGELEFVPNSLNLEDLGTEKAIRDTLKVGESYFMHASESVHRVLPLVKDTNRTVLVFTYADQQSKNIEVSYSSNKLYD